LLFYDSMFVSNNTLLFAINRQEGKRERERERNKKNGTQFSLVEENETKLLVNRDEEKNETFVLRTIIHLTNFKKYIFPL
jgi:hypothetical protein